MTRPPCATTCAPCSQASVRRQLSGPSYDGAERPLAMWDQMVELGWPALAIAEEQGGLGLGFVELAIVAEELGRAVVRAHCSRPPPSSHQRSASSAERPAPCSLPRWRLRGLTGALAVAEDGRWSAGAVQATATPIGTGWVLQGVKHAVVDGATVDEVLVVARGVEGLGAFVVERDAMQVTPRLVVDPTLPMADLRFDGVIVEADRVLALPGDPHVDRALRRALEEATVATAAMTVGACRRLFEETVEYTKAREQYDRPIGSFQALKHRMADMYLSVERATAVVYFAALTITDDHADRSLAAAASKAAARRLPATGGAGRAPAPRGDRLHVGAQPSFLAEAIQGR